jgi:hypothetical protein
VYIIDQNALKEVENTPFVYWLGDEVLSLIATEEQFGDHIFSQSGIKTGNNKVFLRKNWEVPKEEIGDRYLHIIRSDNKSEYFDEITWTIDWKNDGEYLKEYCNEHGHQFFFGDREKFGERGLGFIDKSSYLTAREVPEDVLCSKQLYTLYPNEPENLEYINGYLNSSLCRFIAGGFNPGLDFTQDDVFRLPYRGPGERKEEVSRLVREAVEVTNKRSRLSETAVQFSARRFADTLENHNSPTGIIFEREKYSSLKHIIHGMIDTHIFDEYDITKKTEKRIYQTTHDNLSSYPRLENIDEDFEPNVKLPNRIPSKSVSDAEYSRTVDNIEDSNDDDLRAIAETVEVSPYTIAKIRYKEDLYTRDDKRTGVGQVLSYYLGLIFGRWNHPTEITPASDGILLFDGHFENNVTDYIRKCIDLTFDDVYEKEAEIEDLLNKEITEWLRTNFFRYHHCKEYRRRGQRIPLYWHLESDEGAFSCFVYYHKMDADTLPKLRGQYIDQKLDTLQNRLEAIESELETADGDRARDLRSQKEEVQADIDDITAFRNRVDALIEEGFDPDFEAGIWENIQKVDEHDLLAVPLDKL